MVGDAIDDTERPTQKGKKKTKKQKEKSKNKISTDVNQNTYDENEDVLNDVKVIPVTDSKAKPKKHYGKQKTKHRKHKKHKKGKSNMVEEISDTETKYDEEDSDDEQISNVADANRTEVHTQPNIPGHSDQMVIKDQTNHDPGVLKDITNMDHALHSTVPGTVTHVHFSDDITPRSRTSSTSELDSKRG